MRVFIALELPEEIKNEIGKIQLDLKKAGVQARWIKPELSHLTLAFLDSITPDKVKLIGNIIDDGASQIKPIQLYLLKIGCFPSPTKARIVFVDLGGELGKLSALAIKIRKRLKKEKIHFDEKSFVSHITLGRIKKRQNLTSFIRKVKVKKVKFIISEVSLNKSTLTETGPIYSKLTCVSLA